MAAHKEKLEGVDLVASGGGCFELSLEGQLLYSKLQTGQFPDEDDMVELIGQHLT